MTEKQNELEKFVSKITTLEVELEIDEGNLEEEMVKQSQLYYEASKLYAQAFGNADQAKMITEQLVANLSKECKENALEKVTVKDIDNYVNSNIAYLLQKQAQIDWERIEQQSKGLMWAFDQRGDRLRDLVSLTNIGYYNSGLIASTDSMKEKYAEARLKKYNEEKK